MQLTLNGKTYVVEKVMTRMLQKALELSETVDFSQTLKSKDLNTVIDFVVYLYGNQFTRDDFYDGVELQDMTTILNDSLNGVVKMMSDKMQQFPNK